MLDLTHLSWPFFDDAHRAFAKGLAAWAERAVERQLVPGNVDESCRRLVRALGDAGWLRASVPRAYGGLHDSLDVRNSRLARRPCRLRFWHAGPRQRLDLAVRIRCAEIPLPAAGVRGTAACRLRALRTGGGLRRQRHQHGGGARRRGARAPRRHEDLDLERRHRRLLRGVRPHRRGGRFARHLGLHRGRSPHASM